MTWQVFSAWCGALVLVGTTEAETATEAMTQAVEQQPEKFAESASIVVIPLDHYHERAIQKKMIVSLR